MELRQLKYYVNVVELMSFSEASRKLYISQSTLSTQIKQLEEELNVLFFNRNNKHITLTEAGRVFYQYARECIQKSNDAVSALEDLDLLNAGEIRIGITYGLRNVIPPALIAFHQQYPNIKVSVDFGSSREMMEKLEKNEVDLLITFDMDVDQYQIQLRALFETKVCLIVPVDSPLAAYDTISLTELSEHPLILKDNGFNTSEFITGIFQQQAIRPKIIMEVNDNPTVLELVKNKVGYTIMADVASRHDPALKAIPIEGDIMTRHVWAYSLWHVYESKSIQAFYKILELIKV